MNKEYYYTNEIASLKKMTTRNVRIIINRLKEEKGSWLIHKDRNNCWKVHHLLLPSFNKVRQKTSRYLSINFDLPKTYKRNEITDAMESILNEDLETLTLYHTVERKKANGIYHIHGFFDKRIGKRKVLKAIRDSFGSVAHKTDEIYDLERWKKYITKDGNPIIKLKRN